MNIWSCPAFNFVADPKGDGAGTASWECRRPSTRETITLSQRFASKDEAGEMNDVVRMAFVAGVRAGENNVRRAATKMLREFSERA